MQNKLAMLEWDANTPYTERFAFRGNFASKVYGDSKYQLVGKDPLNGSTTIKKYGGERMIGFGLLTESMRNNHCSGWGGIDYQ